MKKTCESEKRFGKEEWLTAQRKPGTLEPIKHDGAGRAAKAMLSGYIWR
jgi:hypothetical protein